MARTGDTQEIREAFKAKGFIKIPSELNTPYGTTFSVIKDMIASGEAVREKGGYRYIGLRTKDCMADKIWRSWRYRFDWTVYEVAQDAGARVETVQDMIRKYRPYIQRVGKSGNFGLYRLTDRDIRVRPVAIKKRAGNNG